MPSHTVIESFPDDRFLAAGLDLVVQLVDEAIRLANHTPEACIVLQRPQAEASMLAGRDHDWATGMENTLIKS